MRPVKCRWCGISIPFIDKREHEGYCGGKSVPCEICGKSVARNSMITHRAVVHRINPCLTDSGERAAKTPQGQSRQEASSSSAAVSCHCVNNLFECCFTWGREIKYTFTDPSNL